MKKLVNDQARAFLGEKISSLNVSQTDLLGNLLCITAYYGNVIETKDLAAYVGLSPQKLQKDVQSIIGAVFYDGMFNRVGDNFIWFERPKITEFLCAMSAGLIESGWWVDTPTEPESRVIARETIARYIPAMEIKHRSEFRGYLVALEYIWSSLDGIEMRVKPWLRQRYGAKSDAGSDLNAFLKVIAENSKHKLDKEAKKNPRVLLGALERSAFKQRHLAEEGYVPSFETH